MGAMRMLARGELRTRWRGIAVLTLLVGFAGGVVLASAAGARRTASSFDRFVASTRPGHVTINVDAGDTELLRRIEKLPQVEALTRAVGVTVFADGPNYVAIGAGVDGGYGRSLDRPRVVGGRLARPRALDEVALPESTAKVLHLGLGDTLVLRSATPEQVPLLLASEGALSQDDLAGPVMRLRVVGITRSPTDLSVGGTDASFLILTPAFLDAFQGEIGEYGEDLLRVRLRGGASDVAGFVDDVERLAGPDTDIGFEATSFESAGVEDSIGALAAGLALFAAIAGLAGLVAVGPAIGRQVSLAAIDDPVLRSLGMRRVERAASLVTPFAIVAVGGAIVAVIVALALSPLLPFGTARRAEPAPGLSFDGLVLGVGGVAVALVAGALACVSGWRATRRDAITDASAVPRLAPRPSYVSDRLARAGAGPTVVAGVRLALEPGRGRTAVPVRAALLGTAAGVLGVTAALVFATSLDRLVTTPSRYGWNWDVVTGGPRLQARDLVESPDIGAVGVATFTRTNVKLDGEPIAAVGFRSIRGSASLTIVDGRAPRTATEVALGGDTLAHYGVDLGDRVKASGAGVTRTFRVVGQAVFPPVDDNAVLADGAAFTGEGLASLVPKGALTNDTYSRYVVRWTREVDAPAAARRGAKAAGEPVDRPR
ncbi:MAG: hypothetical protein WD271_11770, partial [Acidimicrobiia bacterium]